MQAIKQVAFSVQLVRAAEHVDEVAQGMYLGDAASHAPTKL